MAEAKSTKQVFGQLKLTCRTSRNFVLYSSYCTHYASTCTSQRHSTRRKIVNFIRLSDT